MIRALIFDCFGVIIADSAVGEYRDDAVLDYLRSLKSTYKVALLSNISQTGLARRFTPEELEGWFDAVQISGVSGVAKPDPRAYRMVLERLNVTPAEALMIDDLEGHCEGARAAGLQAVQYRSLAQTQADIDSIVANSQ